MGPAVDSGCGDVRVYDHPRSPPSRPGVHAGSSTWISAAGKGWLWALGLGKTMERMRIRTHAVGRDAADRIPSFAPTSLPDTGSARFSQPGDGDLAQPGERSVASHPRKAASGAGSAKTLPLLCTISGHGAVNGTHSIENMWTYKRVFCIDGKNRRSTTRSFFDSFLSFSGWCGVRGSSAVTFLIERLGRRASKGL